MSETTKYHMSRNGYLSRCTASKRACYLGGEHFTQQQYDQLAEQGDPRVRVSNGQKFGPDSYYGKAAKAYEESVRRLREFDKIQEEAKAHSQQLVKSYDLTDLNAQARMHESDKAMKEALDYAKEVYMEEGVHPVKAGYIIMDMKKNPNPFEPIRKRGDKMDPDRLEKTKNAVARLKADPQYEALVKDYAERKATENVTLAAIRETDRWKSEQMRERRASGYSNAGEEKDLKRAKKWMAAGITPQAEEKYTISLTPEMVSIDDKGKINNVWVETDNGIERVVGYDPREGKMSGALITDKGTVVCTWIHYHSYRSDSGGIQNVIVGEKNGKTHPAKKFSLSSSWDSGD